MDYPVGLNDIFTFGKYKGMSVEGVIDADPKYILWCVDSINDFMLTNAALAYLRVGDDAK